LLLNCKQLYAQFAQIQLNPSYTHDTIRQLGLKEMNRNLDNMSTNHIKAIKMGES